MSILKAGIWWPAAVGTEVVVVALECCVCVQVAPGCTTRVRRSQQTPWLPSPTRWGRTSPLPRRLVTSLSFSLCSGGSPFQYWHRSWQSQFLWSFSPCVVEVNWQQRRLAALPVFHHCFTSYCCSMTMWCVCVVQHALRLIAFRQVHKVLGMDPLPPPRFQQRRFGNPRKRRHTNSGEGQDEGGWTGLWSSQSAQWGGLLVIVLESWKNSIQVCLYGGIKSSFTHENPLVFFFYLGGPRKFIYHDQRSNLFCENICMHVIVL